MRETIQQWIADAEAELSETFAYYDRIRGVNQRKVIRGMQSERLASSDFHWTTGYGYGDAGRDKCERIFAEVFETEDALVRPSIASGTHALALTLQGLLLPGDEMVSISGRPYDTMQKVIGLTGEETGSLSEYGIGYKDVPLKEGHFDLDAFAGVITEKTKLVLIQRSSGYSLRAAHLISEMKLAIERVRQIHPDVIIMVDNCYGEFTDQMEPSQIGADVTVGSLIKNPGGGIAISGGYIAGKGPLIERIANRLTAPGLGKECGLSFGTTRLTLQGLFFAPMVVANAMKGATLFGHVFDRLGYSVFPGRDTKIRSDIVQGIILEDPAAVIAFCRAIQRASAIDSHVEPHPWEMPGYEDQVIMASGGFVEGSSIEMSADGPLRPPYAVFYQGGLSYDQCVFALEEVLVSMVEEGFIDLGQS